MTTPHTIKKHGGARKGSGRKPGIAGKRNRITRSVSLHIDTWRAIDNERGKVNRSRWIEIALNAGAVARGVNGSPSPADEKP